ncbi:hypothetical protein AB837_00506 [bacterium AB1]|nr:hypothetical protein AB837_00506 [bacterium AB1]
MCKKEEIKKIESKIQKIKTLLPSVIDNLKTTEVAVKDADQMLKELNKSFTNISAKLTKMCNTNCQLLVTENEILLDGVCISSLLSDSSVYSFCEYALNSDEFKLDYIRDKDYYDLCTLHNVNCELDFLVKTLEKKDIKNLIFYYPMFILDIQVHFSTNKKRTKNMIEDICLLQIRDKIKSLEFYQHTNLIMTQLGKFRKIINSLHKSIIENSNCVKFEYGVIEPVDYIQISKDSNLQHHIAIYRKYLYFVKQVYSVLDYLNKPVGELVLCCDCLFLDSAFLKVDPLFNKKEILKILNGVDCVEMEVYKQKKYECNQQYLLSLTELMSESLIEYEKYTCDSTQIESVDFFPNLSKKIEKMLQDCKTTIHYNELKKATLLKV